jgi:hypothetical protein
MLECAMPCYSIIAKIKNHRNRKLQKSHQKLEILLAEKTSFLTFWRSTRGIAHVCFRGCVCVY